MPTLTEAFPFSVNKLPLRGPDNLPTPFYGLFRSDSGECIGSACRADYEPHTTDDVIAISEAAQCAFGETPCVVAAHFDHGHCVSIGPTKEYRREVFDGDGIFPRFICRAGYDGRAFKVTLGVYRDVCRNLMMRRGVHSITRSLRHRRRFRDDMPALIEEFRGLATHWPQLVEMGQRLEERRLRVTDFLRELLPPPSVESENVRGRYERRVEAIVTRLLRERDALHRDDSREFATGWELFNAVTGYVQHDMTRRNVTSDFDRALRGLTDPLNERAYNLILAA